MRSWVGSLRSCEPVNNIAGYWHWYGRHANSNVASSGDSNRSCFSRSDHVRESGLTKG